MSKPRPTQAGVTYPLQPPDLPCGLLITALRTVICRCLWAEVNLLNITSVNAQNPQQVKDAMVNCVMAQRGVDKEGAEAYIENHHRMKIVAASLSPVLGMAVASKLSSMVKEVNIYPSGISFKVNAPEHMAMLEKYSQQKRYHRRP